MGLAILLKPDKNWLMQESEGPCALCDCVWLQAGYRGLKDGFTIGQWRQPNVKELHSLIDLGHFYPALSNAAGTGKWGDVLPLFGFLFRICLIPEKRRSEP